MTIARRRALLSLKKNLCEVSLKWLLYNVSLCLHNLALVREPASLQALIETSALRKTKLGNLDDL